MTCLHSPELPVTAEHTLNAITGLRNTAYNYLRLALKSHDHETQDRYLYAASEVLVGMEEALQSLKKDDVCCGESEDGENESSDEEAGDESEDGEGDDEEQERYFAEEVVYGDADVEDKIDNSGNDEDSFTEEDIARAGHRLVYIESEGARFANGKGSIPEAPKNSNSILYIKDAEKRILYSATKASAQESTHSTDVVASTHSKEPFDRENQRRLHMHVQQ